MDTFLILNRFFLDKIQGYMTIVLFFLGNYPFSNVKESNRHIRMFFQKSEKNPDPPKQPRKSLYININIGADKSSQTLIDFDSYYLHLYPYPTSILDFSEK